MLLSYWKQQGTVLQEFLCMTYTLQFFDFQLQFARRLAAQFDFSLSDALFHYTTLSKTLGIDDWEAYGSNVAQTSNATEWTYQWYLDHRSHDPIPADTDYYGHPLFGCFYYLVRDTTIVRVHFMKNDSLSMRPLSRERMAVRQDELRRMFTHIHTHVPDAQTVVGNSWMYHLDAYRRLYPPAYTLHLPMSDEAEFQFLAFWGQCFDHAWNPKSSITNTVLQRLEAVTQLDQVRWCFPYQILQPKCVITSFYEFYGVIGSKNEPPPNPALQPTASRARSSAF
jgi:hypothetical protein